MDIQRSKVICSECKKEIPFYGLRYFRKGNIEVCPECFYKARKGINYEERNK
jgi:hypothetical protein